MNEDNNQELENNNENEQIENDAKEIEKAVKSSESLAKNAATGNAVGAAKDAVKLAKNKKVRRKLITHGIAKALILFFIMIFLGSAIAGIFGAVGDVIQGIWDGIKDFFNVDLTDGSINIDGNSINQIIDGIEGLGVSVEDLKLLGDYTENATEEEKQAAMEKYIRKFYEAQTVTQTLNYYHKESIGNKTYGAVYVYRTNEDGTSEQNRHELTFLEYDKMKEKQEKGETSILNNFSIDDSGNLVIADKTQVIKESGSVSKSSEEARDNANVHLKEDKGGNVTTVKLRTIDYKSAIKQYTTQMNFLVYLTMISQNPEFVSALVDLIKDTRIEITVMDNVSTYENVETYKYTQHKRWTETVTVGAGDTKHEEERTRSSTDYIKEVKKTTTISTIPSTKITYVKTWFCEQKVSYNKTKSDPITNITNSTVKNEEEPSGDGEWKTDQTYEINDTTNNITYEEGIRGDVTFILGQRGDAERYKKGQISEPTFVGLMETEFRIPYSTRKEEAGSNIVSGAEMLFYLLQKDPNLENMELIMRYAINLYLGYDRYSVELDGSIFDLRDFMTASGGSGTGILKEYIREWENTGGAPTNADGTKYIIEDDGAGNLVVGYGVDIYNGGFAELFIEAGYTLEIGAEVDIDFVDALEQQEIDSNISSVKSITSGLNLKEYQIHALVSRAYNCGVSGALSTTRGNPAMNFVDSYKTYWKEDDDQFEEKNSNSNFGHSLYTQYMSKPVTSKGEYMYGLEKRRKSEWTLFQTGYYDVLGKWYEEGGSIIECAREIHQYMEQNGYTYCVYGGNSYEECFKYGKSHGLNRTFEESKNGYHNTCCATFVKWVLQEAGYLGEDERI